MVTSNYREIDLVQLIQDIKDMDPTPLDPDANDEQMHWSTLERGLFHMLGDAMRDIVADEQHAIGAVVYILDTIKKHRLDNPKD